jgi:acetyl-CoA C-acetyltransferase
MHRNRRLEELAAPVIAAALSDAKCDASRVEGLILGNATAGGNPARTVALASGLPGTSFAVSVDSQCASGLDAIIAAFHRIDAGEADVIVAGGAESLSTAPWRIARPKNQFQMPHFIGVELQWTDANGDAIAFEASEALAHRSGIDRAAQDAYAAQSHTAAAIARDSRQFIGEIVPVRMNPEEMRDQTNVAAGSDDLSELTAFQPLGGTLTPGNTSALADGAALCVIVSGKIWRELGSPRGLVLQRSVSCGAPVDSATGAGLTAMQVLIRRSAAEAGRVTAMLAAIETSEASAAEAISIIRALGLPDGALNAGGGAIVRGHPLAAASAVSAVRLFTRLIRNGKAAARSGCVVQGAIGGIAVAAAFEVTG